MRACRQCNRVICSRAAAAHHRSCPAIQSQPNTQSRRSGSSRTPPSPAITRFYNRVVSPNDQQTRVSNGPRQGHRIQNNPNPGNATITGGNSTDTGSEDRIRSMPAMSQQSTTPANQPQPSQTISQQAPTTANPIPDRPSRTPTSPTAGSRRRNQRPAQRQQHTLPTQGQGITNITWEQMAAVDTLQILNKNIVAMDRCPAHYRTLWK